MERLPAGRKVKQKELFVSAGNSWATDTPYSEASTVINYAKKKNVVCFAHLTNTMTQNEGDFEKGNEKGAKDSLKIIYYMALTLGNMAK